MGLIKLIRVHRTIKKINKALNIELYSWQKDFIFYDKPIPFEIVFDRCRGKSTAQAIKICVSASAFKSDTINLMSRVACDQRNPPEFIIRAREMYFGEDGDPMTRRMYFRKLVKNVYNDLSKDKSIKLRKIIY